MSKTRGVGLSPALSRLSTFTPVGFCRLAGSAVPLPPTGDPSLAWEVGLSPCSLRMDASRDQRVLVKTKITFCLFFFFPLYLGFGTLSSGTAVHTESGVFCSLNRPLNTFSMSSMLNAHTADPGMLQRGTASGKASGKGGSLLGPRSKHITAREAPGLCSHLLSCVVNTPTTVGMPLICMMSVMDCRTSK